MKFALLHLTDVEMKPMHAFISQKSKGFLTVPSDDDIFLCTITEKYFRRYVSESSDHDDTVQCSMSQTYKTVLKSLVGKNYFSNIEMHMFDHEVSSNHIVLLMKAVMEKYLQVRYFHAGKKIHHACQHQV